jgi:hypothetical protein
MNGHPVSPLKMKGQKAKRFFGVMKSKGDTWNDLCDHFIAVQLDEGLLKLRSL